MDEQPTARKFILRITKEEWFRQVFTVKKYYPGISRLWESAGLIFLAKRTDRGDSFVGYGVIKEFIRRENLPENERRECERMGWRGAIVFDELYRFDPPLPIKETALSGLKAKGKCWHGYPLTDEQSYSILSVAEELCAIHKVG